MIELWVLTGTKSELYGPLEVFDSLLHTGLFWHRCYPQGLPVDGADIRATEIRPARISTGIRDTEIRGIGINGICRLFYPGHPRHVVRHLFRHLFHYHRRAGDLHLFYIGRQAEYQRYTGLFAYESLHQLPVQA